MTGREVTGREVTGRERGSVTIMVAVLAGAIFAALALVVDGGRALGALVEAQEIADNAARAGARVVDVDRWRDGGRPIIDRGPVEGAVGDFMATSDFDRPVSWAVVEPTGPDADVTVAVEVAIPTRSFLFPSRTVTAVGTASALDGVDGP